MNYGTCYLVRFEGTLSQGPNAGKSYTFASSWGGVQFDTPEQAKSLVAKYKAVEPSLRFQVCSRQFHDGKGFVETIVD